jgi:plastocyanin
VPPRRRIAFAVGSAVAAALLALALWPRPAVDIRIPRGGVAAVHHRFGRVAALPETLVVAAGGRPRVRITNADTAAHQLGLFSAPPGRTVEYTLPTPGTYTGLCSVHPTSETLTFVVR